MRRTAGALSLDPTGGFQEYRDTPVGVIANDDGNEFANDKELMTADANPSSPKVATSTYWTRFNAAVTARSTSASRRRRRSLVRPDRDQRLGRGHLPVPSVEPVTTTRAQPVVGSDGTIYVSFANGNVPGNGHRAGPERDLPGRRCSNQASWTAPKLGDMISTSRRGRRQRLPEQAVPTAERVPRSRRDDRDQLGRRDGNVYVTWADHRNNRTRTASRARPAAERGRATTTSSTRSRPMGDRRGATRRTSRPLELRQHRTVARGAR